MSSVFYKPFAILASVLGGLLAGALFGRLWKLLPGQDEAPDPDDQDATWAAVIGAAAVHGLVAGTIKAATKRAGAKGFEKATGTWPGESADATARA